MSDQIERIFHDLSVLPVIPPSEAGVRQRRRQRQLHTRLATSLAVVALVAAGATTAVSYRHLLGRPNERTSGTAAPGVIGPVDLRAGYPGSFLAVRSPEGSARIAQMDSTTGEVMRYLTGRDTVSPAIAGGSLYYLKAGSGCSKVLRQPLAGGDPRQVQTGKFAGVDQVVSDGDQRLAWVGCELPGKGNGFWQGKVLHVQNVGGGQARDVKVDLGEFGINSLAVGRDGRLAVGGQTTTSERSTTQQDATGKPRVVGVLHDVMYVVDPARADRLSAGHRLTPPAGCYFSAAGWHGTDLIAAVSCLTGNQANGSAHDSSRLLTVSGRTLEITGTLAQLGAGDVFSLTVAHNGATLAVMGNGAGIGPVPRVVNGSVTLLPGIPMCLAGKPCADYFETPVWLQ